MNVHSCSAAVNEATIKVGILIGPSVTEDRNLNGRLNNLGKVTQQVQGGGHCHFFPQHES
jgi:hypothetical protein